MNKQMVVIAAVAGFLAACAPASNIPATGAATAAQGTKPAPSGARKADKTVAEIYAGQNSLLGSTVTVRGKVVKFSAQIMGKNWVHLQDGTGAAGSNDLTITTADTAKVGDVVLVSGKITQNKDFGSGYSYSLIFEDAKVVVEGQ